MEERKAFNIRITKSLWLFLKKASMEQEMSMQSIIHESLANYKKLYRDLRRNKLQSGDTKV